jgi:hypothetical protein
MVLAADLPAQTLKALVIAAAQTAIENEEVVCILGASSNPFGHFCRLACRFTHPGSILVLPDLGVIEMYANSGPGVLKTLQFVASWEGRSVAICRRM